MSVPCGLGTDGLPVGLQLASRPGGEWAILAVAQALQRRTDWHLRRPGVSEATTTAIRPSTAGMG